jgi:hypothetical protein
LLKDLCDKNSRLEFLALPSDKVIGHGQALSYLQTLEHSDYFCFMDSDILAAGEFLRELTPYVGQYTGVFSGSPIWCRNEEQVLPETSQGMGGRYNRANRGMCLGSTYFAIYDNRILSQFIQSTGISFRRFRWRDIPIQWKDQLVELGMERRSYDTGKVLNLLLLAHGEQLSFVESSFLQHIGGISDYAVYRNRSPARRIVAKLKRIKRQVKLTFRMNLAGQDKMFGELVRSHMGRRRRNVAGFYFTQVLRSSFENRPPPAIPDVDDPEIAKRFEWVTMNIVSLYEEFGEQLRRLD